jgi:hypothetical protein
LKRKAGQPSKFPAIRKKKAELKKLLLCGLTDKQICDIYEINPQTWYNWQKEDPKFFESLKNAKTFADTDVIYSLYKRATGFEYTEETIETDGDGKVKSKKKTKKYYPPDVTGIIYWLRNRQKWIDKIEVQQEDPDEVPEFANMSNDELESYINKHRN